MNHLNKLKDIRCFIFDVDGVLTDGHVLALESGEQARSFLVKDGYAIERALLAGYIIGIISGGNQIGVRKRLEFLKIPHIHLGVKDKVKTFETLCQDAGIIPQQVLYMGDDWPDFEVMQLSGIPCCPADAVPEVKQISLYVATAAGGQGCVREVIELVMKAQNRFTFSREASINN